MATCKECIHFEVCEPYTAPDESYPEVGGCYGFKSKDEFVHVVRCKDCQHFYEINGKDSGKPCGYGQCLKPLLMPMLVNADEFCSNGERRENNEAD